MSLRKRRIRLLRWAMVPVVLIPVFVPSSWTQDPAIDFPIEWFGYLLLVAGLGLRIWSILYVGQRKSKELVTTGPYSLCRNPLYLGTFAIAVGAGLSFANVLMVAAALVVIVPIHLAVIRLEEPHLRDLFGRQYDEYARRIPRLLPSLRHYSSPKTVEVSTRAVRRVTIEAMGVLMIPLLEDLFELLHANGVLPVLWHFP